MMLKEVGSMNFYEKIICFLQSDMETPKSFGWFHISCLIITLIVILILCINKNKHNEKTLKKVLGIYGITALILETLKQISWSFNYDELTKIVNWDYQWYAFPFQLCTTPLYISIICLFLKKGKLRESLLSYMAYVTILGSIATIIMPDSCFTEDILVNVHTMWLHLGSFVVSIYLLMTNEVKTETKNLKKAINIFITLVIVANLLNITIYNTGILNGETFNMFYISPYFNSILPVFSIIQPKVPYLIYLLIYIIILIIGSSLIFLISKTVKKVIHRTKKN